jgi:SAM-dependent methyltransferase
MGVNRLNYTDINAKTWDLWSEEGMTWTQPITHDEYMNANAENYIVYLTPCVPVPHEWFGELAGKKLLGLASGGGQQMPIFAALGAECTVLDYSLKQLESERLVAEREGYAIEIIRADMTKPLPFADDTFDLIFHPVSNCYVEEVKPIFKECYRILKKGGALLSGLDNGVNYIFDEDETTVKYKLPFNALRDPAIYKDCVENDWGIQFSHTFEDQIGGQLEAGLMLTHVYEDTNGAGNLHEHNIPTFWATRAVKA